jgi:hypothetical protein
VPRMAFRIVDRCCAIAARRRPAGEDSEQGSLEQHQVLSMGLVAGVTGIEPVTLPCEESAHRRTRSRRASVKVVYHIIYALPRRRDD